MDAYTKIQKRRRSIDSSGWRETFGGPSVEAQIEFQVCHIMGLFAFPLIPKLPGASG